MSRTLKFSIVIIGVLIICLIFYWIANEIAPGSYPYAERYEMNINESALIDRIENFKRNNPQYNIPKQMQLTDERDETGHWFFIYFYFPEENQIINTWVRQMDKNKTAFAFVGVNNGLTLGNWKYINRDFNRIENKEQKKKFEERILNKLKY